MASDGIWCGLSLLDENGRDRFGLHERLGTNRVKGLLDFGPMLIFMILSSPVSVFPYGALLAFLASLISLALTSVRAALDRTVRSPKIFVLADTVTFGVYLLSCLDLFTSYTTGREFAFLWQNPLMFGCEGLFMAVGALGFDVLAYEEFLEDDLQRLSSAVKEGIKKHGRLRPLLRQKTVELAATFGAVAAITAVPPTYWYATGDESGTVYSCLSVVCAWIAPFAILGGVIYYVYVTAPAQIHSVLQSGGAVSDAEPLMRSGGEDRARGPSLWGELVVAETPA
jgi:hypothetical protein